MDKIPNNNTLALTLALTVFAAVITGCGTLHPRNPVPEDLVHKAEVPELGDIRFMLEPDITKNMQGIDQILRPIFQSAHQAAVKDAKCCDKELSILSLSGGGDNGAFGAGILNGWTASGDRPKFDIVTGISTGALQAPFVFLGSDYDSKLQVYSKVGPDDVYHKHSFWTILHDRNAAADFAPLMKLIARMFGESELKAVAREYNRGRLLFIGTTNLEAQQLVVWNMGAIAASGHPGALDLFRKVMIASASLPVAVSPVYFNVEADGKTYDELHVDGGMMTQVFGVPLLVLQAKAWRKADYTVTGRVYIIRNARLNSERETVKPKLSNIAGRSISTLIKMQGIGDIYRAYAIATNANFDFNHIAIPRDFKVVSKEPFDTEYMKALYDFGFEMSRQGLKWGKSPFFIK